MSSSVVGRSDGPKSLLPSCVPVCQYILLSHYVTWLSHYCHTVTWLSHEHHTTVTLCHMTVTWASHYCHTVTWLSHEHHTTVTLCHMTVTWASHYCHTVTWLSHDCHMTVTWLPYCTITYHCDTLTITAVLSFSLCIPDLSACNQDLYGSYGNVTVYPITFHLCKSIRQYYTVLVHFYDAIYKVL